MVDVTATTVEAVAAPVAVPDATTAAPDASSSSSEAAPAGAAAAASAPSAPVVPRALPHPKEYHQVPSTTTNALLPRYTPEQLATIAATAPESAGYVPVIKAFLVNRWPCRPPDPDCRRCRLRWRPQLSRLRTRMRPQPSALARSTTPMRRRLRRAGCTSTDRAATSSTRRRRQERATMCARATRPTRRRLLWAGCFKALQASSRRFQGTQRKERSLRIVLKIVELMQPIVGRAKYKLEKARK